MSTYGFINANEMWSMYLFNQMFPKKGAELLDESIIRDNAMSMNDNNQPVESKVKGDVITLSAKEFMDTGAGQFVNGANFTAVKVFFSNDEKKNKFIKDMAQTNGKINENGEISFSLHEWLMVNDYIYNVEHPENNKNKEITYSAFKFDDYNNQNPIAGKAIKQSYFKPDDESDYDFFTRVELFETTRFQIGMGDYVYDEKSRKYVDRYDKEIKFIITHDGEKYITNFVIMPSNNVDNFDFIVGNDSSFEKAGNEVNMYLTA